MQISSSPVGKMAYDYMYRRFPRASEEEIIRMIKDWELKIIKARGVVSDFKKRIGDVNGLKIIDIGCGNGGLSIAFSESGAEVTGVDIETELINIATKNAETIGRVVKFIKYDGNILPFPDNFFDAAVSVSVLEHVDNPILYLSQVLRVLKPGGCFYLAFPNRFWPKETHTGLFFLGYLPERARDFMVKIFGKNPLRDNNLHFYSYYELMKILNKIKENTSFFFAIKEERGNSKNPLKVVTKFFFNLLGFPHQSLLPHIMLILNKTTSKS